MTSAAMVNRDPLSIPYNRYHRFVRFSDSSQGKADMTAFDGKRAWKDIATICSLGPRPAGSDSLEQLRLWLEERLTQLGFTTARQPFGFHLPSQPDRLVRGINLTASWGPHSEQRLLLGTHIDTRPRAEEEPDPALRNRPIVGANDGASGAAVLLEIARLLPQLHPRLGIDLLFFDAEEYVLEPALDPLVVGSRYFAQNLPNPSLYQAAIIVDMVARPDQRLTPDVFADTYAPDLTDEIWNLARELKLPSFFPRVRYEVLDDHVPLLNVGIPAVCLIDVDDPHWHTLRDLPHECDPHSLTEVGTLLFAWLRLKLNG